MIIEIHSFINPQYGRQFPVRKDFQWNNQLISTGLREQVNQIWPQPKRHWYINWDALTRAGRDKFLELFNRAAGVYRTFHLLDREDYQCSLAECSVTAAGGETTTQLNKDYYHDKTETWNEEKKDIVPGTIYAPTVKIDAAVKTEDTHFTLDDTTGLIDWTGGGAPNGALGAGEVVTADYQFYFPVRFDFDRHSDINHIPDHWQKRGIHLVEVVR